MSASSVLVVHEILHLRGREFSRLNRAGLNRSKERKEDAVVNQYFFAFLAALRELNLLTRN